MMAPAERPTFTSGDKGKPKVAGVLPRHVETANGSHPAPNVRHGFNAVDPL